MFRCRTRWPLWASGAEQLCVCQSGLVRTKVAKILGLWAGEADLIEVLTAR